MGNGKYHTEGMQSTARCCCYPTDLNATSQFSRKTDKTTAEAGFNWQMEFSTGRAVDSTERAVKTHIHTYPIFFLAAVNHVPRYTWREKLLEYMKQFR